MTIEAIQPARDALAAVKLICDDVLAHGAPVHRLSATPMSLLDLAVGLRQVQHAAFIHYLRNDASVEALKMIVGAIELTEQMAGRGDLGLVESLKFESPCRHHLYVSVTRIALRFADQFGLEREIEYWRRRKQLTESGV